jgi:hypothetical protein
MFDISAAVARCREAGARGINVYAPRFIQLQIDQNTNLHFWGLPTAPTTVNRTGLHNHYVDFRSDIILGQLTNTRYFTIDDPHGPLKRYYVARQRKGPENQWEYMVTGGQERVLATPGPDEHYAPGDHYRMTASELHVSTTVGPAITLMSMDLGTWGEQELFLTATSNQAFADLFVPKSRSPKNDTELADCWSRVDSFLQLLKDTAR